MDKQRKKEDKAQKCDLRKIYWLSMLVIYSYSCHWNINCKFLSLLST